LTVCELPSRISALPSLPSGLFAVPVCQAATLVAHYEFEDANDLGHGERE
jgi:hypothetical protein